MSEYPGDPHAAAVLESQRIEARVRGASERGKRVLDRAAALDVRAEWVGPAVRLDGTTMTVANAEAWLDGYGAALMVLQPQRRLFG